MGVQVSCNSDGVSDTIRPYPGRQCKLPRSASCFHCVAELACENHCDESTERTSVGDASYTSISLLEGCHGGQHQTAAYQWRDLVPREILCCFVQQRENFLVLQANSQHLVRAPSWTGCHTRRETAKTIVKDRAVHVQWMFWLELCDCPWNLPHLCLWTLASQLSKGLCVLGGQSRTNKFMSCSGHLPSFDPTLGGLPSANPLFLLGEL